MHAVSKNFGAFIMRKLCHCRTMMQNIHTIHWLCGLWEKPTIRVMSTCPLQLLLHNLQSIVAERSSTHFIPQLVSIRGVMYI